MKRRDLIYLLSTVSLGFNFRKAEKPISPDRGTFAIDANRVRFYNAGVRNPFSILMIADTHLFTDDARGERYQQYSGRMAKAYNHTKNFQTGEPTFPAECFQQSLDVAKKEGVSLVALIGDIMSFPSEAAVEWVSEKMKMSGLPYLYVAGNHDWHYEGMAGSLESLRNTWIHQRLLPLYQNDNPLMTVREINGIRLVAIDNSNYEGATYIHNLNYPILEDFKNKYDYIYDGGTTEHIFNIPQVFENIIDMLNIDGLFVSVTCNNNFSGHGMYQFSPELYLSCFNKKYGMKIEDIYIGENGKTNNEWKNVNSFNGYRNLDKFNSTLETYIIIIARKISNERELLLKNCPNQFSYDEHDWKK